MLLSLTAAIVLFFVGLKLSAFFSGAETGFYRVSTLRLSIDAGAGDRIAERLLWFTQQPSYFVATTLVGNNVANYLTTFSVALATIALAGHATAWVEIVGTLLLAPVIFIFGELLPKNLYYRAPMALLRRSTRPFTWFYRLFLVVSFPLVWITKAFEALGHAEKRSFEFALGRSRLVHVLRQGHHAGLLSDVQSRLVHGLLHTAAEPVSRSMTPVSRALSLTDDATGEELLKFARDFGLSNVLLRSARSPETWQGYVRVIDVAVSQRPIRALLRPLPMIDARARKLDALLVLREAGEAYGLVQEEDAVVGTISERGLVEQLFHPPQTMGTGVAAPA